MNIAETSSATRPGFLSRMVRGLYSAMTTYAEARGRAALFRELDLKSDRELAEIGLRREDIARYVFRDLLHV